jgi:hypothetical protein
MGNFQSCKSTNYDLKSNNNTLDKNKTLLGDENLQIHNDIQSFFHNINDEKINELVNKILENDSINFTLIPDEIEKQLYHNMIKLILAMISDKLD